MKYVSAFLIAIAFKCVGSIPPLALPGHEDSNGDYICRNANDTMTFTGMPLKRINENFLSSSTITCLDLSNSSIELVDSNAFNNLPNLKFLNLSSNKFDIRDVLNIGHLNLETLILDNIENNCEFRYRVNISATYPRLKKLVLGNKCANLIFDSSFKTAFPSLTELYYGNNEADSESRYTEPVFQWLPGTIEYLDLSGHSLTKITLENLDNLQFLIVSEPDGRQQKKLSALNLRELKNLRYLKASPNALEGRIEFSTVPSLIFLDISNNYVRSLRKYSLQRMENLNYLNLSKNCIGEIEAGAFDGLVNLEVLDLKQNRIDAIPILSNAKLRKLVLNCNDIRRIAPDTFKSITDLEVLHLDNNRIKFVDQDAFVGLGKLKTLTMSNNLLTSLPQKWMVPLVSLKVLHLASNKFQSFENLTFSGSSLENLYWSVPSIFTGLKSLNNIPENVTISFVSSSSFLGGVCTVDDWQHCIGRFN